jgi:hypothetical protein
MQMKPDPNQPPTPEPQETSEQAMPTLSDSSLPSLDDSEDDPTRICWTQLLRAVETEEGPRIPFPPLHDEFCAEDLFT